MKFCPCCGAEIEEGLDECPACVEAFVERKNVDEEEDVKDLATEQKEKEEKKAQMAAERDKHAVIAFVLSIVSLCFAASTITPVNNMFSMHPAVAIVIISVLLLVTLGTFYVSRMFHFKAFDEGATTGIANVSGILRRIALPVGVSFFVINLVFIIVAMV